MRNQFDELAQKHPDEPKVEFWFARDLREPVGYARWENFLTAIGRAIESCESKGYGPDHQFRGVTKLVTNDKGGHRPIDDFIQTRYLETLHTRLQATYLPQKLKAIPEKIHNFLGVLLNDGTV